MRKPGIWYLEKSGNPVNHLHLILYIPKHFKKGIKLPVFKGSNKDPSNKDDYRGITVTPILSKLFEMYVMRRVESWFYKQIDELQGVGKQGLSSLHSSMLLREIIVHNVERGNPVHVVLLDTRKAFD